MIDLKPACHTVIDLLESVSADQLDHPTPCAEYSVADLIHHFADVAQGFGELARKQAAGEPTPRTTDIHKVAARVWELGEAWAEPTAWEGTGGSADLQLPNEQWGKIALTELVVHGWDIAVALDRTFWMPEETLRSCLDHVAVFIPNAPIPALWAPAVETPDDAPLIHRIVAITGRDPHWTPATAQSARPHKSARTSVCA
ncbi:TIGR03086 family metal-binding protein [Nocardia wallacei]|uniref:TIGR03086 family metal-binding protein n=1 Tax=Nocardia wallacei TaxID=480035 RepID=UPI0024541973|nr:TIGR03086 family metal-binding protein [Nocardia wallacei]